MQCYMVGHIINTHIHATPKVKCIICMPISTTKNITPNDYAIFPPWLYFNILQVQLKPIGYLQAKTAPSNQLPRGIWVGLLKPTGIRVNFNPMSFSNFLTDHGEACTCIYQCPATSRMMATMHCHVQMRLVVNRTQLWHVHNFEARQGLLWSDCSTHLAEQLIGLPGQTKGTGSGCFNMANNGPLLC